MSKAQRCPISFSLLLLHKALLAASEKRKDDIRFFVVIVPPGKPQLGINLKPISKNWNIEMNDVMKPRMAIVRKTIGRKSFVIICMHAKSHAP